MIGDVGELVGIAAEVIEFFGGAAAKDAREVGGDGGFVLVREEVVFDVRGIDVAVRTTMDEEHIGVACGPTVGAEVVQVEEVASADGAHGIT